MGLSVSWSEGITSISKKERKYRYFDLFDPPDGQSKEKYEVTQRLIAKEIQEIKQEINSITDNRVRIMTQKLGEKQKESLENEATLYKSITKKKREEYYRMSSKEKINFWTDYYILPQSRNKSEWTNLECFALLIRSTECYLLAKSEDQEIFSRTKLLGSAMPTTINKSLLDEIIKELNDSVANITINQTAQIIEQQIRDDLTEIFTKGSAVSKAKKRTKNEDYGAATFSKNLREELREYINEKKLWSAFGNEVGVFKLTNDKDTVFLQVLDSEKRENIFSKNQNAFQIEELLKGNEQERQRGISLLTYAVRLSFLNIIKNLKTNSSITLNLRKTFGEIKLNSEETSRFLEKAKTYVKKDLGKFLREKQGEDIVLKTFKATRSNAFVSGLLGELAGAIQFSKQGVTKMTGNVYGEIDGSNFGGSVNDITVSQNNINYGVNIKHYITKDNNITLYDSQKNELSINSTYLAKYYSEEEIATMKWAVENQAFLNQRYGEKNRNFAKDVAFYYSWKEIPTFLRVEDYTQNSLKNLFFQLNNIIYPTSVIYDVIIEQLDKGLLNKIENKNTKNKPFFSISQSIKNTIPIMYENRNDALFANPIESVYKKNYLIDGKTKNGNLRIKTNGLNINLEQLNLLMR